MSLSPDARDRFYAAGALTLLGAVVMFLLWALPRLLGY